MRCSRTSGWDTGGADQGRRTPAYAGVGVNDTSKAPSTPHGGDCSTRTNRQPFEDPCDDHRGIGVGSGGRAETTTAVTVAIKCPPVS
jgi:hypothetical protein